MTQPIKTYRQLSEKEIELMNELKILEEQVLRKFEEVESHTLDYRHSLESSNSTPHPINAISFAITQAQAGFMWANRAIARPQRISLPEDDTDGGE